MGLLKRLLQEEKGSGLLKRAVTLKNYEFDSENAEEKKNGPKPLTPKPSSTRKKA
jgi:hypothetical protein